MFVVSGSTYQQNNNEAGNEGILLASSNHLFQDKFRIYYVIEEYFKTIFISRHSMYEWVIEAESVAGILEGSISIKNNNSMGIQSTG